MGYGTKVKGNASGERVGGDYALIRVTKEKIGRISRKGVYSLCIKEYGERKNLLVSVSYLQKPKTKRVYCYIRLLYAL